MRIALVSERLRPPYDEGIKNFAIHLLRGLQACGHATLALTTEGESDPELGLQNVAANRLLLNEELREAVAGFEPEVILYIPTACGTAFSLVRGRVLHFYYPSSLLVLLLLQPRPQSPGARLLMRGLRPDLVLAQSTTTALPFRKLGWRTALFGPAVDSQRFRPASAADRSQLRSRFSVPEDRHVVLHVGHLKEKRNLLQVLTLHDTPGYHVLIVASTSTEQDARLGAELRSRGATVVDHYVADIENIYRLSDAYVFLAEEETAAIDLPLSVVEAMACNLPVVSTPFGGLPDSFREGDGLVFWQSSKDLRQAVDRAMKGRIATRNKVEGRTWQVMADELVGLVADDKDES